LGLQQPLQAEQLKTAAELGELLVNLGAGGARAKMATTAIVFHSVLLNNSDISEFQEES
jgi:hypothetical protein